MIDLAGGQAVHARGGQRAAYAPVRSALLPSGGGADPVALARAYLDVPVAEIYVADLDAIAGDEPAWDTVEALSRLGVPVWIDAGQRSVEVAAGAPTVRAVIGLETLRSWHELAAPGAAFSLDLRRGRPLVGDEPPAALARRAVAAGASAIVLLDLARVGSSTGLDWVTVQEVRTSTMGVELIVGGGVRDSQDVDRLADLGCNGVLVATALHERRLGHGVFLRT